MIRTVISLLSLTLLLSSGLAASDRGSGCSGDGISSANTKCWQAGGPGRGFGGPGGRGKQGGRQMRKHIEQLRMLKLLELLNLDEDQEVGFLVAYQRTKRDIQVVEDSIRQQVDSLSEGLKQGNPSDEKILGLIADIDRLEMDRLGRMRQLRDEVQPILTAEQLGKVVVFMHRFEEELLRQVRAFRNRGDKGPSELHQLDDSLLEPNR